MPTHDEIPDRYPVLDHMQRRRRREEHLDRAASVAWSVCAGLGGGGLVLAVMLVLAR
jgi:hypothetical protein